MKEEKRIQIAYHLVHKLKNVLAVRAQELQMTQSVNLNLEEKI